MADLRRTGLRTYFLGAYVLTWMFWMPVAVLGRDQPKPTGLGLFLIVLGGLGPMLAAILVTAWESGSVGVRALFRQLLRWRVGPAWYVVALAGATVLVASIIPLHLTLGGSLDMQAMRSQLPTLPLLFVFVALLGGGLDEEMGWRAYALPQLQARFHPLIGNLILGVLWSGWHLPLWFVSGSPQASTSFPVFVVTTTSLSFLLAWVYNGSGGSLLIAVLAHTSVNVVATLVQNLLLDAAVARVQLLQKAASAVIFVTAFVVVLSTHGSLCAPRARRSNCRKTNGKNGAKGSR